MPITPAFASRQTCVGPPKQGYAEKHKTKVRKINPYRDEEGSYTTKAKDVWVKGRGHGVKDKDTMRIANLAKAGPKALAQATTMAKSITDISKAHRRANAAEAAGHSEMATVFRNRAIELGKAKIIAGRAAARLTGLPTPAQAQTIVSGAAKPSTAYYDPKTYSGEKAMMEKIAAKAPAALAGKAKESFEHLKSHDAAVQQIVGLSNLGGKMQRNAAAQKLADKITDPDIVGQLAKSADIVGEFALSDLFNERRVALQQAKAIVVPKAGTPFGSHSETYQKNKAYAEHQKARQAEEKVAAAVVAAVKPKGTGSAFEKFMQAKTQKEKAKTVPGAPVLVSGPPPTPSVGDWHTKDAMRISDMANASRVGGMLGHVDMAKMEAKARTMANSIKDAEKAQRRANAAENDNYHSIAKIFRARANALAGK
jgi:hypothetical protein